jgi:hypothetical protein
LSAGFERARSGHIATVGGHNDYSRCNRCGSDLPNYLDAVHLGHLKIEQGNVRMERVELLECFTAATRFPHCLHISLTVYESSKPSAKHGVVIHHKDACHRLRQNLACHG